MAPWILIVSASDAFGPTVTAIAEQPRAAAEEAGREPLSVPLALDAPRGWIFGEALDEPARPPVLVVEAPPEPPPASAATIEMTPTAEVLAPAVVAAPAKPPGPEASRVAARGNSLVLSPGEIYALTLEVSGDPDWATWATRVIACESGGRVNAISPGGHYGLGQVASGHPYDFSRMISEPRYAVEAMLAIYRSSGPGAWSCK